LLWRPLEGRIVVSHEFSSIACSRSTPVVANHGILAAMKLPPMLAEPRRLAVCLTLVAVLGCDKGQEGPSNPEPTKQTEPTKEDPPEPVLAGILGEEAFKALHELSGEAAPPPKGETIDLAGTKAYLSLPEGATAPLPAVVVVHEWWGLNDHIRHWTDRLAADGYATLAVDLYGGQVAGDPDAAMTLVKAVDPVTAQAILSAAHTFLASDPRIDAEKQATIGWCFGGGWALQDAIATRELDAAVIYYGRLVTDAKQLEGIQAAMLGVFANQDEGIPPDVVDGFVKAVEGAGKSIEMHRYDAVHAFANPSNPKYDQKAASDAWNHVRAFLAKHLKGA
jgi:carboxymethylenebutenolidase